MMFVTLIYAYEEVSCPSSLYFSMNILPKIIKEPYLKSESSFFSSKRYIIPIQL